MNSESVAPREQERTMRLQRELVRLAGRLAAMAALLWLVFGVLFGLCAMTNDQMSPRLYAGDLILYYRLDKNYVANDVIVAKVGDEQLIGRVIAKPGDEVDITKEGKVVINGSLVVENDIFYPTPQYDSEIIYPVLLKEDEYFVLCDQRNGAKDSRIYGTIQKRNIKGKVITLLRKNNI